MKTKTHIEYKPSALPIYMAALSFSAAAIPLSMIKISDYLICAGVSILTYALSSRFIKPIACEVADKPVTSGDQLADQLLEAGYEYMIELEKAAKEINNSLIEKSVNKMLNALDKILIEVRKHPHKAKNLRKFINYYLPTLIKLLKSYDKMEESGISEENVTTTMHEIEAFFLKAASAFEKQLDKLYADEKLDITSDIDVLETLMSQQGLFNDKK